MAAAFELVDLAALCAEALAWALLTVLVILLAKLISVMHFKIDILVATFEPLGWLANALNDHLLAGAEIARQAVAGAMKATFDGLVWAFNDMLAGMTEFANHVRAAFVYLWSHALHPFVTAITAPIRALAAKAEAAVVALETTVAKNLVRAEDYAAARATAVVGSAEAFTRIEIKAARADAAAASDFITRRLDGIGAQAEAIAGDIAAEPGLVWDDLKTRLDPKTLAEATILGVLGALGIHSLTSATGLDSANCQQNQKALCGTEHGQWLKLLEGLALIGFALDFKELVAFAEKLAAEAEALILKAA